MGYDADEQYLGKDILKDQLEKIIRDAGYSPCVGLALFYISVEYESGDYQVHVTTDVSNVVTPRMLDAFIEAIVKLAREPESWGPMSTFDEGELDDMERIQAINKERGEQYIRELQ